jgi:hypothetical protein
MQTYFDLRGALKRSGDEVTDEDWVFAFEKLDNAARRLNVAEKTLDGLTGDDSLRQEIIAEQHELAREARVKYGNPHVDYSNADTPLRLKYRSLKLKLEKAMSSSYFSESVDIDGKRYTSEKPTFQLDKAEFVCKYRTEDKNELIGIRLLFLPNKQSTPTEKRFQGSYPIYNFRGNHRSIDVNGIQIIVRKYRPDRGGPDLYSFLDQAIDLKAIFKIGPGNVPTEKK